MRHFLVWGMKKHWAPSLHGSPIHLQMRCFHCSFHNLRANKQQVQHAKRDKRYIQVFFMVLKQQEHTLYALYGLYITQGHPLTSHSPYVIKVVRCMSTPIGGGWAEGGRWWLEQERVLALSSQGIVGRRAQERRWSITGGGGCYVALPGNRKA